jgi:hypothetical protein
LTAGKLTSVYRNEISNVLFKKATKDERYRAEVMSPIGYSLMHAVRLIAN